MFTEANSLAGPEQFGDTSTEVFLGSPKQVFHFNLKVWCDGHGQPIPFDCGTGISTFFSSLVISEQCGVLCVPHEGDCYRRKRGETLWTGGVRGTGLGKAFLDLSLHLGIHQHSSPWWNFMWFFHLWFAKPVARFTQQILNCFTSLWWLKASKHWPLLWDILVIRHWGKIAEFHRKRCSLSAFYSHPPGPPPSSFSFTSSAGRVFLLVFSMWPKCVRSSVSMNCKP